LHSASDISKKTINCKRPYPVARLKGTKQSWLNQQKKTEPLEKQLWKAADKLRKNIDAAEYKHVVMGLIFLKYISDSFEEMFARLQAGEGEYAGADPDGPFAQADERRSKGNL
jgi:type I restriction-modification system DNA methylase subunit